jgi:hypothetical protein
VRTDERRKVHDGRIAPDGVASRPGENRQRGRLTVPGSNPNIRRGLDLALIVGFVVVDLLLFHDIFKAGELTIMPDRAELGRWARLG